MVLSALCIYTRYSVLRFDVLKGRMERKMKVKKVRRVRKKFPQKITRLLVVLVLFFALFSGLFARIAYIKGVHGEEYERAAREQQVSSTDYVIPALRGSIVDSNGEVLVQSVRVYNVIVDSKILYEATDKEKSSTAKFLCDTLSLGDVENVAQYYGEEYKEYRYLRLPGAQGISEAQKATIEKGIEKGAVVGIWFEETEKRTYPHDSLAAHILGFNGTYGVEQYYNEALTGTQGRKMVVTGENGSYVNEYIAAQDGSSLTLTINATVQYHMETILEAAMAEYNVFEGCAICMNPKTGAIYGWVNMPTFNLNNVEEVIGVSKRYEETYSKDDENYYTRIWNNWGLTSTYQPGSTYKPIFSSAALDEALFGTGTTFECGGSMPFYDTSIRCHGGAVHGVQTLRQVLCNSCNVGMTKISELIDKKTYLKYQDSFGIGSLTGIDLVGEVDASQLIYTEDTMGPVELATTSFGQGFNVTPIQLITAFSSVINGGEVLRPYVVNQITDSSGNIVQKNEKTVLRRSISEETSKIIRSYLIDTVEEGGAGYARVPGYKIGGKTGTAEQGDYAERKYIVSFIGYTPVEDPEVVLLVVLNQTDSGTSADATRTAGKIFKEILPVLGLYPEA